MRKIIGRKDTCEKFLKHLYYGTANFKDEIIQVSSPYKANMFSKIEMHKCGGCDVGLPLRDFVRSSRNHFAQCFYKKLSLVLPFFTQVHVLCDLTSHFGQKRKKKKNIHTKSNSRSPNFARKNGLSTKESYEQKLNTFTAAATVKF